MHGINWDGKILSAASTVNNFGVYSSRSVKLVWGRNAWAHHVFIQICHRTWSIWQWCGWVNEIKVSRSALFESVRLHLFSIWIRFLSSKHLYLWSSLFNLDWWSCWHSRSPECVETRFADRVELVWSNDTWVGGECKLKVSSTCNLLSLGFLPDHIIIAEIINVKIINIKLLSVLKWMVQTPTPRLT